MKMVRVIIGIVAIIALMWFVYHVWQQRRFKSELESANASYAQAASEEDVKRVKESYEGLLAKSANATQRSVLEANIVACDANLAYYAALSKGTTDNYTKALELLK